MEMTPDRKSAQDADFLSGLEKLRTQRSAFPHSHGPGGHRQDLTNPRGGPNQMIKSGPDRVDKPSYDRKSHSCVVRIQKEKLLNGDTGL